MFLAISRKDCTDPFMQSCWKTISRCKRREGYHHTVLLNGINPCLLLSTRCSQIREIALALEHFIFRLQLVPSKNPFFVVECSTPILIYVRGNLVYEKFFLLCNVTFYSNQNCIVHSHSQFYSWRTPFHRL